MKIWKSTLKFSNIADIFSTATLLAKKKSKIEIWVYIEYTWDV